MSFNLIGFEINYLFLVGYVEYEEFPGNKNKTSSKVTDLNKLRNKKDD